MISNQLLHGLFKEELEQVAKTLINRHEKEKQNKLFKITAKCVVHYK